ncbi:MAG: amidohydrolase family protein [Alphaproteobacteria bacterium]|nr:amidohydrolase family protein [Alphaproteobacteria bacterium]
MTHGKTPIIDAQVHAYEADTPDRPWAAVLTGPPSANGAEMVAAMDAVGVDGAILVSAYTMYRYDPSFALQVHDEYPDRFGLVTPFDAADPGVGEKIDDWAGKDGTVGIRLLLAHGISDDAGDEGISRLLEGARRHALPVNVYCTQRHEQVGDLAARFPDVSLVVDHMGLVQPFHPPAPEDGWAELPKLLALSKHKNVSVKISGAGTLAHEPFPFPDIREPVHQILDAFGLERCMWGTDWTRAVELLSYEEGFEAFRQGDWLSESERAALMGGNAERIYGWSPAGP